MKNFTKIFFISIISCISLCFVVNARGEVTDEQWQEVVNWFNGAVENVRSTLSQREYVVEGNAATESSARSLAMRYRGPGENKTEEGITQEVVVRQTDEARFGREQNFFEEIMAAQTLEALYQNIRAMSPQDLTDINIIVEIARRLIEDPEVPFEMVATRIFDLLTGLDAQVDDHYLIYVNRLYAEVTDVDNTDADEAYSRLISYLRIILDAVNNNAMNARTKRQVLDVLKSIMEDLGAQMCTGRLKMTQQFMDLYSDFKKHKEEDDKDSGWRFGGFSGLFTRFIPTSW